MRIYLSSINHRTLQILYDLRPDVKVHILRSYLNNGPETLKILYSRLPNVKSIALDSNTYHLTTNRNEHNISLDSYANFLSFNCLYDFVFNFDDEHGADSTENNWEKQYQLEMLGLNVIPVIHNLDIEVDHVIREKYELIAIGSTRMKKYSDIEKATIKIYPQKVHLFGVGSFNKLLNTYAWSADCSSFAKWIKSGRLIWYDKAINKEVSFSTLMRNKKGKINKDYVRTHSSGERYESWLLENLGFEIEDLIVDHQLKLVANAYYFYELQNMITSNQIKNGIEFNFW